MLGVLSRNQLTDLESLLSSSTTSSSATVANTSTSPSNNNNKNFRFDGSYIDPYRFVILNNNNNKNNNNTPREAFECIWKWDSHQASTYVLWWTFRPPYCKNCGSVDSWKPSPDFEYICPQCFTGAGTTSLQNDIVTDSDMMTNNKDGNPIPVGGGGGDSSDSDGDGDPDREEMLLQAAGGGGGGGAGGLLQTRSGEKNGLSSGNIYSSSSVASNTISMISLSQWVIDLLRKLRFLHFGLSGQLDTNMFPAILKVTINIITLLYLPDMTSDCIDALKAASLYVACTCVIPSVVSFPSLQSVVADGTSMQQLLSQHQQQQNQNQNNNNICSSDNNNNNNTTTSTSTTAIDVRWTDVIYVSSMIGVEVEDFFAGDSRQHTRNLVALMMDHQPSGKLYDTARSSKAQKILIEMKKRAAEVIEVRKGERFSPDHTAAIFVLECGRQQPELVKEWKNQIVALLQQQQSQLAADNQASSSDQVQSSSKENNNNSSMMMTHQNSFASSTTSIGGGSGDSGYVILNSILQKSASEISLLSSSENNNNNNSNDHNNNNKDLWTLLIALAETVKMTPASFAEMVDKSGFYGEKIGFYSTLQQRLSIGEYLLPLTRRLSPCVSPWNSVFRALHSDDRLPLLAALNVLSTSPDATKRNVAALNVVQQILRKHGSLMAICFNYVLYVNDPSFKPYHGLYFCTQIDRRGAMYMSLSQSKSIRFMGATHQVYLNEASERNAERLVASHIGCHTVDPLTLAVETQATKLVIDCVQQSAASHHQQSGVSQQTIHAWNDAAAKLNVCAQLRRKANATTEQDSTTTLTTASASTTTTTATTATTTSSSDHHHHHHHEQTSSSYETDLENNRIKCLALLSENIRGMLANERKNPSWTTSVLTSCNQLEQQVKKFSNPESLEKDLIDRGVLPKNNLNNNTNSEFAEAVSSLHHRIRRLGVTRMNDLEALVLNSSVNALQEYHQLHHSSSSPALKPSTSSSITSPSNPPQQQPQQQKKSSASNSASPPLNPSAKRRSRSPPSSNNNNKASPKMQPLPAAAVTTTATSTTTTSTQQQQQQQPVVLLPPGISNLFLSALKSRDELTKRI